MVIDMIQLELLISVIRQPFKILWIEKTPENRPFTLGMKVDATDCARTLIEANIIKALETGTGDCLYFVIGDQKEFLPSHKQVFAMRKAFGREACRL